MIFEIISAFLLGAISIGMICVVTLIVLVLGEAAKDGVESWYKKRYSSTDSWPNKVGFWFTILFIIVAVLAVLLGVTLFFGDVMYDWGIK